MSEHSKEPWTIRADYPLDIRDPRGDLIATTDCSAEGQEELDKANARRLVACVNACQRFTTEQLESDKYTVELMYKSMLNYYNDHPIRSSLETKHEHT